MNKYKKIAELLKVLSNPRRIEILTLLSEKEMTVTELVDKIGIRKANVSQHMAVLRFTKMVHFRREGKRIFYRIAGDRAIGFIKSIQKVWS